MAVSLSRENNFDLLRLLAALQVVLYHCAEHLHLPSRFLNRAIHLTGIFSGVPVFFVISGFLVFASFDRNPGLKNYCRNRFLRIYPGLWLCLLVTICVLFAFGFINVGNILKGQFWLWLVTQVSFLQFYTPGMFRQFGVGSPNGALWTIPVEISFYLFVPFLFWLFRKTKISRNTWIIVWITVSVAYNVCYQPYKFEADRSDLVKLMGINLGPYLFYFLLGALAYNNWDRIRSRYEGNGLIWLLVYLLYCFVFCFWLKKFHTGYWTNFYHFIAVVLLSQTILALAFTYKGLSERLLHKNDPSFGIYIYHMPVINMALALGYGSADYVLIIVLPVVAGLAFISWRFVEHRALSLKRSSIHRI